MSAKQHEIYNNVDYVFRQFAINVAGWCTILIFASTFLAILVGHTMRNNPLAQTAGMMLFVSIAIVSLGAGIGAITSEMASSRQGYSITRLKVWRFHAVRLGVMVIVLTILMLAFLIIGDSVSAVYWTAIALLFMTGWFAMLLLSVWVVGVLQNWLDTIEDIPM